MSGKKTVTPRRGGRPSLQEAEKLGDKILDAAAALFFAQGYGAVSVEEIARQAGVSKRTFYARFDGKPAIFRAVVQRLIQTLRPAPADTGKLFAGAGLEEILRRIAPIILHAALSPQALALHRVILAEATRFPELALIMNEQGARQEAIDRIAALLQQDPAARHHKLADPAFAAEQFMLMLTSGPQRRAMGMGKSLDDKELQLWADQTIDLFLNGYRAGRL